MDRLGYNDVNIRCGHPEDSVTMTCISGILVPDGRSKQRKSRLLDTESSVHKDRGLRHLNRLSVLGADGGQIVHDVSIRGYLHRSVCFGHQNDPPMIVC